MYHASSCNNCLKGGLFPGDVNGAWGCVNERLGSLSLEFCRLLVAPAVVIACFTSFYKTADLYFGGQIRIAGIEL